MVLAAAMLTTDALDFVFFVLFAVLFLAALVASAVRLTTDADAFPFLPVFVAVLFVAASAVTFLFLVAFTVAVVLAK